MYIKKDKYRYKICYFCLQNIGFPNSEASLYVYIYSQHVRYERKSYSVFIKIAANRYPRYSSTDVSAVIEMLRSIIGIQFSTLYAYIRYRTIYFDTHCR